MREDNEVRPARRTTHDDAAARGPVPVRMPLDGTRPVRVFGDLIRTVTRDILDYFGKCPHCGYAVQVSEVTRTFSRGLIERTTYHTCGLPCGWHDSAQIISEAAPSAP